MPPIFFSRTLIAASLTCFLAACGGSSSDNKPEPQVPSKPQVPSEPQVPSKPQVPSEPQEQDPQTLPKLFIQTESSAPVTSKEDYLNGTVRIESEEPTEQLQADTRVKGRGNTTWGMDKKPYRLKLDKATSVLGMPAERDWALLANYADKTMVRNKLAMELGEEVGLTYNPRSRFVELYLNNEYQGVYELFEHREVGPNKIAIEELDPEVINGPELTGGYLLEVEHRMDEDVCWESNLGVPFCVKDPEWDKDDIQNENHPSYAQYNYIVNYVNATERSMDEGGDRYSEYLDPEAAVNWYLVNELLRNNDADMHSSVFLHKSRDGRLTFGPLWDFDLSSGNVNYNGSNNPEGWHIRDSARSAWHQRLFNNTDFGERVFAKWCSLKQAGVIDGLGARIDNIVDRIDEAAIDRNFKKWPILGVNVGPNEFVGDTYESEVDYLKSWLQQRATWMDAEFGACPAP